MALTTRFQSKGELRHPCWIPAYVWMEADWPNCQDTLKLSLQWRALRKSMSSGGILYPQRMLHTTC
eukprot:357392-Rhodomonas_salina.1